MPVMMHPLKHGHKALVHGYRCQSAANTHQGTDYNKQKAVIQSKKNPAGWISQYVQWIKMGQC